MAKTKPGKIHAILGRSRRTGRWRLGPKTSVVAVLGSCRLDLRHAHIDGETSKMTATVFLGAVTIVVPPGVEVRPSGLSLLGGACINVPPFDDVGDPILIELEWTSIFGRLRVGAEVEVEVEVEAEVQPEMVAGHPPPSPPRQEAAPVAPPPAIGFEDLDEPTPEPPPTDEETQPTEQPEPAPAAVGFEDL